MNTTQDTSDSPAHSLNINCTSSTDNSKDEEDGEISEDPRNITIPVYKKYKIRICKPLIPLKIALFVWFGGGSSILTFIMVFLKQRGISLSELSWIYALTPIAQFFGPTICGIIADKIGRPKPVLVVNLLLTILIIGGMIAAPHMNSASCDPQNIELKCHREEVSRLVTKTSCDADRNVIELAQCNVTCPENVTQHCLGQNLICEILNGDADTTNFSLSVHVSILYKLTNRCYYNVQHTSHRNTTYSWCNVPNIMHCNINCIIDPKEDCSDENNGRSLVLFLNTVLLILFHTVVSITYRFLDVTVMLLVKEHDSDFGRERMFGIIGVIAISPLVGYLVDITSIDEDFKNYDTALYWFISTICLLLPVLYILDVKILPPGKNMCQKGIQLFKNLDIVSFFIVLLVLGTTCGFMRNFLPWYIEGLNAPSVLLGLMSTVSSLYCVPFLMTSNWWVKKIGTKQILLLAHIGYLISGLSYSFLLDPWLSLLIEATGVLTYHLFWVAVVVYSHSVAPEGLTATVIAAAGGIHFSIGRGTGGLIGGSIMSAYGGRIAYRSMAIACFVSGLLYAVYIYLRKKSFKQNLTSKSKNGTEDVNSRSETAKL